MNHCCQHCQTNTFLELITHKLQLLRPRGLAYAKREAAKRDLYSRFFHGPVLSPSEGNLSDSSSGSGSSSGKSEAPAVDEVKLKFYNRQNRKSVEDAKEELKVDKQTTKKDGTQEGVFVKQSEEAMARKTRKRDKRAAKIKARENNCPEGEGNRQRRKGKQKGRAQRMRR